MDQLSYTFALTMPQMMMMDVIAWTDQQDLGAMPEKVAIFLAHVGNANNWQAVSRA